MDIQQTNQLTGFLEFHDDEISFTQTCLQLVNFIMMQFYIQEEKLQILNLISRNQFPNRMDASAS